MILATITGGLFVRSDVADLLASMPVRLVSDGTDLHVVADVDVPELVASLRARVVDALAAGLWSMRVLGEA